MGQLIKALLICLAFVALGIYALHEHAPGIVSWGTIVVFGSMLILGIIAVLYQAIKGKPLVIRGHNKHDTDHVRLKDGRDYEIEVSDAYVSLINKVTGEKKNLEWSELTAVYIVAKDAFPIGSMSYLLHRVDDVLEIPTDAEGNNELLRTMQQKLSGFDNKTFIEAMGMVHGFKQVWKKP